MEAPVRIRPATEAEDAAVGELLIAAFEEQYARLDLPVVTSAERRGYLRDPSGDIDRLPYIYPEARYLPLEQIRTSL